MGMASASEQGLRMRRDCGTGPAGTACHTAVPTVMQPPSAPPAPPADRPAARSRGAPAGDAPDAMPGSELPPPSWRRRTLVLGLAIVTACSVLGMLIWRPGDPKRGVRVVERTAQPPAAAASAVGGLAPVRLVPSSAPAR
jgi:hypothetical protein